MIPGQKSSFFLEPATYHYISRLLPYGLKVFLYEGYLHAKTISVDEEIVCIGSVNMDIRSLEIDDEVQMIFYGSEFAQRHGEVFRKDIENCREMDYAGFLARGFGARVKERVFQLFAPLM